MRYLAIDYGEKRIGLAGSRSGIIVSPLEIIFAKRNAELLLKVVDRIKYYDPQEIVIGLPLSQNGEVNQKSEEIYIFSDTIKNLFKNIKVHLTNEFLSTVEAKRRAGEKRRRQFDDCAAAVILEQFLNQIKSPKPQD